MKNRYKKIIFSLITIFLLIIGINVLAQGAFQPGLVEDITNISETVAEQPGYVTSTGDERFFGGILIKIFAFGFSFLGIFFMLIIIYSGFQWMFSSGNEEKVTKARARITQAVIGLAIILSAYIVAYAVFSFLTTEYLQTPSDLEPPPGYQDQITCTGANGSTPPECGDRGSRIYCFDGNCVECVNDSHCSDSSVGLTYCDPNWHVCTLPLGTACSAISDPTFCTARDDCNWDVGQDHETWLEGVCVNSSSYNCTTQCSGGTPVCGYIDEAIDGLGVGWNCLECMPGIQGDCHFPWTCWSYSCFP